MNKSVNTILSRRISQGKKKTNLMQHKRARIAFMRGTFIIYLVMGVFSSVCIAT